MADINEFKKELEAILEYASDPEELEDEIKAKDWKIEYEIDEDIIEFSDKVEWESKICIETPNFICEVYIEGTATAEISYERWVDTYNYWLNDYSINKIERK
jgi:hypothetical protein